MTLGYRPWQRVGIQCQFARFTDWQSETLYTTVETITANNQLIAVTNPGNIPQPFVVIRFRANAAGGFQNPHITNDTNGYVLGSLRDSASINDEVKYDTEVPSVGYSIDNGVTYADDFANHVIRPSPYRYPALAFQIEPATNTLRLEAGGTPINFDVEVSLYGAYA